MLLSMTRIIQAESASIRAIHAAGPDQIGGRLARKTFRFKPFQSNSNRFKPKKSENRFPSNPGLYRLLPPVTAHYGLLPPKNARHDFPPGTGLSGAYRQSAAPKKCENRHLAAFHPDLTGANRTYPDLKNLKTLGSGAFSVPRSPFASIRVFGGFHFLVLFNVVWCSLAQFGAKKLLLFFGIIVRYRRYGLNRCAIPYSAVSLNITGLRPVNCRGSQGSFGPNLLAQQYPELCKPR